MELYEEDIDQHISKKISIPKDITNMVLFLCSDKNFIYLWENICIVGRMTKQMIYHYDYNYKTT